MKDRAGRFLRPADLIAVAAILLLAGVLWLITGNRQGETAQIVCDKEVLYTIRLSDVKEPYEIRLENGITVAVEPGAIFFAASDCANRLCVRTGKLTRAGQSAACLPHKTLIRVTGRDKAAPDALTG